MATIGDGVPGVEFGCVAEWERRLNLRSRRRIARPHLMLVGHEETRRSRMQVGHLLPESSQVFPERVRLAY
jgi:hypothetical protein